MHFNFPFSAVRYLYCKSSITSPRGGGGLIYLRKEASKALMHFNLPFSAVRYLYCKSSITSPLGGGGGCLFTSNTWEGGGRGGGLNRDGDLFNLAKTMVLILH